MSLTPFTFNQLHYKPIQEFPLNKILTLSFAMADQYKTMAMVTGPGPSLEYKQVDTTPRRLN